MMNSKTKKLTVTDLNPETGDEEVISLIKKGLLSERKHLPSKLFYDDAGSELFEGITKLDEYYPPRIEAGLLREVAEEKNSEFNDCDLVELGSGDCSKISILLGAIPEDARSTIRYIPMDISRGAIEKAADALLERFRGLRIHCIPADFTRHLDWIPDERRRVFLFLGGTIGNLSGKESVEFMKSLGRVMNTRDSIIVGMDMVKDTAVLEKAYNDSLGVTARFNKNILNVVNRHTEGNFNPDDFEHAAFFNIEMERIEMHLKAESDVFFESPVLKETVIISAGETIHTENSHKFTPSKIKDLAGQAGLGIHNVFTDDKKWFSLAEFKK